MFKNNEVLNAKNHKKLGLKLAQGYGFSENIGASPLAYTEILHASLDYPILFSPKSDKLPGLPTAILGVNSRNSFIDAEGKWRPGCYIPAHFRRYPFVLGRMDDQWKEMLVMIDQDSDLLVEFTGQPGVEPLFTEEGKNGAPVERALTFLNAHHEQIMVTYQIVSLLREHDLLTAIELKTLVNGEETPCASGFEIINEERLDSLSDETFLDLRRQKILPLIYAHLASLGNTRNLVIDKLS